MSAPRVVSEPVGGGALTRAALEGSAPRGWFAPRPRGVEEWRGHAEVVRRGFDGVRWLEALRPALQLSGAAQERMGRVVAGNGIVVTTGQQPGLFGGPGYTWLKAISALGLADRLERELGVPVAPVFWAATDDADFEEASFTDVSLDGAVRRVSLEKRVADGTVMAQTPLGDVGEQMRVLMEAAGSAAHGEVLAALQRAYRAEATVGSAYVDFLRDMLQPMGIAVLDSWHPAVRAAARPTLVHALARAAVIDEAVALRTVSIERAGYRAQVARVAKLSLVFRSVEGRKERVPLAQAIEASQRDDLVLSSNVLLRPVVERQIMPTVAYVGGPGEIAYFAQVSAAAEAMGVAVPLVVPRWSATVIEPSVDRMLGRLGMVFEDIRAPHVSERRIGERAMPAGVRDALGSMRTLIDQQLSALDDAQQGRPLVDAAVIAGAKKQFHHQVERLERRVRAAATRGETLAMADLAAIRAAVLPRGERQERSLNYAPMFARHGDTLWAQLRAGAAMHAGSLIGTP